MRISTTRCLFGRLALIVLFVLLAPLQILAVDLVWMRHEPEDNVVDHFGHDSGATVPEMTMNLNTYGCCGGGGNVLGIAPLANGGYVVARRDIRVTVPMEHEFDSFVHDGGLGVTALSNFTRGLNSSTFLAMVGLSNGNYVWGRTERSDNLVDFFLHDSVTAAEIADDINGRGVGTFIGMAPVTGGHFVWGREDPGPSELQWFLHDGTTAAEIGSNTDDLNRREIGNGALGVTNLADGNFVYGRDDAGQIEWFINSGTTADELAADLDGRGVGQGVLDVIGLANGDFVYARDDNGEYDLAIHSGTTAGELTFADNVRGVGTFLGMVPLPDGSFVYAREDNSLIDLFQYDGSTLAEIGVLTGHRGVGAGGILFDGIAGLVTPPTGDSFTWNEGFLGDWSDANNWDPNTGPPGAGDSALIDSAGSIVTVTGSQSADSVDLSDGELEIDTEANLTSPLTMTGGSLTGFGTVTGNVIVNGGSVSPGGVIGAAGVSDVPEPTSVVPLLLGGMAMLTIWRQRGLQQR